MKNQLWLDRHRCVVLVDDKYLPHIVLYYRVPYRNCFGIMTDKKVNVHTLCVYGETADEAIEKILRRYDNERKSKRFEIRRKLDFNNIKKMNHE